MRVVSIMSNSVAFAIANAKTQERTRLLSTTIDGLTGLYNFSGFRERLEMAFQELGSKRRQLSLIIMDLDKFRELNALLGYEIGNQILKKFARLLLELTKDDGVSAARIGPDEFALILPNIAGEQALSIAQKIHRTAESLKFVAPSHGVNIFISVGVSSLPQDARFCNDLVDSALHALSLAKSRGGNRAICYNTRNAGVGL
jgi:diguanylate cyclase (GGDEF)-like protein